MPETQDADVELNLSQYVEILLRRRWVFTYVWIGCFVLSAMYAFLKRPVWEGDTLLDIEKPSFSGAQNQGGVVIESIDDEYFQTQYRLIKSDTLTQKVYDDLHLDKADDFAPPLGLQKLQDAITVTPLPKTRLAYVQVQSHDPALAVLISTTLASDYVQDNLNNALFMSRDVLQALQLDKAGVDRNQMYESLPAVVDNKLIQDLKEQKITLEGQIADLSMRFTANHPQVVSAKGRLDALNKLLTREVNNIIASLKAQLSGQLLGNNVRVVDQARIPDFPAKPKKLLVLALGLVGGMLIALFAALAVEFLDQSVRTEEDVERKLHQSFLGVIPQSQLPSDVHVYAALLAKEPSLTSEAFRNLRTMIDFAGAEGKSTPLLVTSSVQEEGKSFVAANLAVVFAQLGERVLIIDGDLRRPKVHKNFGLSSEHGVCDFLAGGAKLEDLARLAQATEVPNLRVLPCGPRPPNPSELLNTPRVSALMAWANEQFDRVIIDCTPMFPISDTLLWGRLVRSAVFVARFGRTRANIIRSACDRLSAGGVKPLGVVINGTSAGGLSYAAGAYYEQYYQHYTEPETASRKGK